MNFKIKNKKQVDCKTERKVLAFKQKKLIVQGGPKENEDMIIRRERERGRGERIIVADLIY